MYNDTDLPVDSVQVTDDLSQIFAGTGCSFSVTSIQATGHLVANYNFNGSSDINLVAPNVTMPAGGRDSITITLKVDVDHQSDSIHIYNP